MRYARLIFLIAVSLPLHVSASQTPQPGRLDQRVTSVVYQANNVVKLSATYGISTMIVFDDDETFETISLGDTESWQVAPTERGNILFVKPIARDVATNMSVVTTKRIYFLELTDHAPKDEKQIFGVRFVYPDKAINFGLKQEAERRAAFPNLFGIDKAKVNSSYSSSGDPDLRPSMMFDDGKKTFLRFEGKVPAIFAVTSGDKETLRNFRKEGAYVVLDGVERQYTLRDGDRWVCVFNLKSRFNEAFLQDKSGTGEGAPIRGGVTP
ncbi:TrbG/VirB9 family P-type conjugative transfer protein [Aliirhizobium smilacinae]|uniref:Conjugal transfer protein TrbG n=1 Tax=Aliirhizobium smilacinae TaxID=1395944 RepID=A0A5C4XPX8_9HYPH|nr:TrbG/VirB9 family P-type conjugative transfer protein [Rhizobium smilacinae]TNM65309.1 conjugal transfer protein TrbG [Rhizobium smilacinae]